MVVSTARRRLSRVFVLAGLLTPLSTAAAPAQSDLCALLSAQGATIEKNVTPMVIPPGMIGNCLAEYTNRWAIIDLFTTSAAAHDAFNTVLSSREYYKKTIGLGEEELMVSAVDAGIHTRIFRRRCFMVQVSVGEAPNIQARTLTNAEVIAANLMAGAIDTNLKNAPDCAGAPAAPVPARALGVSLRCDSNFSDPGLVVCAAAAVNPASNARITYKWQFDGAGQSATGAELRLTGVKPGRHTIAVTASDSANNQTSSPQSVDVTKTGASGSGGSGSGGSTGPGLGGLVAGGILITALVGGAILIGAGRRRNRGGAAEPGSTPQVGSYGYARPGATGAPASVAPPQSPLSQPRPTTPVAAPAAALRPAPVAIPASPPAPPPPREPTRHEGEIWLEETPSMIRATGDGKTRTLVTVRAWQIANGVRRDVTAETVITPTVSDPRRLSIERASAYGDFAVTGRHLGVTPFNSSIAFFATVRSGQPISPLNVPAQLDPLRLTLRVIADKNGFLRQDVQEVLGGGCAVVRARLVAPRPPNGGDPAEELLPVAHARCQASLQVEGGGWSAPSEVRTDAGGRFLFQMPAALIQAFPSMAGELTLSDVRISADAAVRRALDQYRERTARIPAEAEYSDIRRKLVAYSSECFARFCARPENETKRLLSGLRLLGASILFVGRNHEDFVYQRGVIKEIAFVLFGSVIDIVTDIIPVGALVVDTAGARGVLALASGGLAGAWGKLIALATTVLPDMCVAMGAWLSARAWGRPIFRLSMWAVRTSSNLGIAFVDQMLRLSHGLIGLIKDKMGPFAAKLSGLDRLVARPASEFGAAAAQRSVDQLRGRIAAAPETRGLASDALETLCSALLAFQKSFFRFLLFLRVAFFFMLQVLALMIVMAIMILTKAFMGVVMTFELVGGKAMWVEAIEKYIGDYCNDFYDGVSDWIARRMSETKAAPSRSNWVSEWVETALAPFPSLRELDQRDAEALRFAYERVTEHDTPENVDKAVAKVAHYEAELLARWQKQADALDIIDGLCSLTKPLAKLVQMIQFARAALVEGLVTLVTRLASGAGMSRLELESRFNRAGALVDSAGQNEQALDLADLAGRLFALGMEIAKLYFLVTIGSSRVHSLFNLATED